MARRAVETLLEVSTEPAESTDSLVDALVNAGRELAETRPGVGAIAGATGRILAAANAHRYLTLDELRRLIDEEGQGLLDGRIRAAASIAIQLQERLAGSVVFTHSASATVREALLHTPPERAICTVSEPIGEGRAFAEELRAEGLNVDLVEDADAPAALDDATLFLLGADTVFRDGTLCNKIGTTALAEAAAARKTPVVVACEIVKLAPIEAVVRTGAECRGASALRAHPAAPDHGDRHRGGMRSRATASAPSSTGRRTCGRAIPSSCRQRLSRREGAGFRPGGARRGGLRGR